jgi:hypothetical protein
MKPLSHIAYVLLLRKPTGAACGTGGPRTVLLENLSSLDLCIFVLGINYRKL